MFKIPNWVRWLGFTILAFTLILACTKQPNIKNSIDGSNSPTSSSSPLVSGTISWIGYSGHYVAVKKDLFTKSGLQVRDLFLPSSSELITAFLAGKTDIAWVTSGDALQIVAKDPSTKLIYLVDYSNGSDGIVGRNIETPQNLKGKTVARENILFEKILLQAYLKKGGLTESDLKIKDMDAGAAGTAFASKQVDAAVTFEPYLTKSAQQGGGKVIFTTQGTNLIADVIAVREQLIQNRRADLQAYLKAIDQAVKLVNAGDLEALKIVATKMGVGVDEVKAQLTGAKLFDAEGNKTIGFNKANPNNIMGNLELTAQAALDFKVVSKPINTKTLYDASIIEAL